MLDEFKKHFTSIQILITLLIIAVGIYIFQLAWAVLADFSDVILILISAWLLSFILEPMVHKLTRYTKLYKPIAALIVYVLFFGILGTIVFLFIPIISAQLQGLLFVLPKYLSNYPSFINKWGDVLSGYVGNSVTLIPSVAQFIFDLLIVLIISFYFVLDKNRINDEFLSLIPKKWHKDVKFVQEVIDSTFSSFLQVQLLFGLIAGVITYIVLALFGIDFALSTAFLAGVLTIVPLLGPVLGIIPPVVVSFATDPGRGLFVFILLLIAQQIIFNVIGPRLLGHAFKIHPIVVLLSFIIGYKIAGPAGSVLAIPVLGILTLVAHRLGHHFLHFEEK